MTDLNALEKQVLCRIDTMNNVAVMLMITQMEDGTPDDNIDGTPDILHQTLPRIHTCAL